MNQSVVTFFPLTEKEKKSNHQSKEKTPPDSIIVNETVVTTDTSSVTTGETVLQPHNQKDIITEQYQHEQRQKDESPNHDAGKVLVPSPALTEQEIMRALNSMKGRMSRVRKRFGILIVYLLNIFMISGLVSSLATGPNADQSTDDYRMMLIYFSAVESFFLILAFIMLIEHLRHSVKINGREITVRVPRSKKRIYALSVNKQWVGVNIRKGYTYHCTSNQPVKVHLCYIKTNPKNQKLSVTSALSKKLTPVGA